MSVGARQATPLEFEALAEIATGPTARVDLCRMRAPSPLAGRLIAVKRLHPHVADDPQFMAMFEDEAWMTAALRHPNVVEVVGWGTDAEGMYLAVELVEGVSLARLMKTVFDTGEAFTERMVVFMGSEIAAGLAAAHALRSTSGEPLHLVHRDLTPGNVLVGFAGQTKITDFGLAKAKQRLSKTLTGLLKGHPQYMAPEQARAEAIDGRADLFSLGVLLFELFTGQHPWSSGNELEVFERVATQPHADLLELRPKIDKELVSLVHHLLERDPARRPHSAAEVRGRLLRWLDTHGYAEGNDDALGRFVRRNAMRQMRWFERAVAGEFRGAMNQTGASPAAARDRPAATRSRRERALADGRPARQEPTSPSPGRRSPGRASPDDATDVGHRFAVPASATSIPSVVDVSGEWSEEVPTVVRPKRSPEELARAAGSPESVPVLGYDEDSDQGTTDVHPGSRAGRAASRPGGGAGELPRLGAHDAEDDDSEELPTRPQRRPGSTPFGRSAVPVAPVTLQAASGAATLADAESLHAEARRVLALADALRERADAAAKLAAQRAVLAQLGADAAQLASDALQAASTGGAAQARALLSEARRIELSIERGERSLPGGVGGAAPSPQERHSAPPVGAPPPEGSSRGAAPGVAPPGYVGSGALQPSHPPSVPPPPWPSPVGSTLGRVGNALRADGLRAEVLGLPLWLALGLAFALAIALVLLIALLLG